jgi:hypothetical protein
MTSPAGFLDFFVLEASDYIEQLDGLLSRSGAIAPDAASFQRLARALRGSATMAKLPAFAELAGALERIGRAVRDGTLPWEPGLSAALVAAVDDLKTFVRAARDWTPAQAQRASARAAELSRLAPEHLVRPSTPSAITGGAFFASEAANVAAGLELLATRPADREGAVNVLRRVRALRGVAGIKELAPLAEVLEAAELAAKPLELGEGPLTREYVDLLNASAVMLRGISAALRAGAPTDAAALDRVPFDRAMEALLDSERARERIVPITELFYADNEPGVVRAASNPPTSVRERFRLEMVSQAEHLRGLVDDARVAPDDAARDRLRRELRRAVRAMASSAESFGEREVALQLAGREASLRSLDDTTLDALDAVANVLAQPGAGGAALATRLAEGSRVLRQSTPQVGTPPASAPPAPPNVFATPTGLALDAPLPPPLRVPTPPIAMAAADLPRPSMSAPAPAAAPPSAALRSAPPPPAPAPTRDRAHVSGDHLAAALNGGLASLGALSSRPLTPTAPLGEQPAVPIDALVYRGKAALERAIEIREELRRASGPPSPAALEELYDLLDLALSS